MKKWLLMLMISLFWGTALFADVTAPSSESVTQGTPRITIPDPAYQFDPVIEGDVIIHEFTIINNGAVPLEILKIETG